MPRLTLNDVEQSCINLPEFWGELLEGLEQMAGARGEVVTAVRFNGVEDPTFREPESARKGLRRLASIEVETATPRSLVDEALAQGRSAANALAAAAAQTSETFRSGRVASANKHLSDLGEGIRTLLTVLGTASAALGISLDDLEAGRGPVAKELEQMVEQLEWMIQAQQSQDWITLADILEYDVQPALTNCRDIFDALFTHADRLEAAA